MRLVGAGGMDLELAACPGYHRQAWRRCPTAVVTCHVGTTADDIDHLNGENRVLTFFPLLAGSRLLQQVDMADVDDTYQPGHRVVTLGVNETAFVDDAGEAHTVFAVTELDQSELTCFVSVFTEEAEARAHVEAATEP